MRHANQVLSRTQLLNAVWGYDFDPGTNVVEVYIGYLRKKLSAANGAAPIETVRSVGYRLVASPMRRASSKVKRALGTSSREACAAG